MSLRLYARHGGSSSGLFVNMTPRAPVFDGSDMSSFIQMGGRFANGEAAQGAALIMDPVANVDQAIYLPPHGLIRLTEDAPGCEYWLHVGRTSGLDIGRDVQRAADTLTWDLKDNDPNTELDGQAFSEDWVRPQETDTDRLYALHDYTFAGGSSTSPTARPTCLVTVSDSHLCPDTNTILMPAKTYPAGTQPREVVDDCASTAGKVYGVVIHHGSGEAEPATIDSIYSRHSQDANVHSLSSVVVDGTRDNRMLIVFHSTEDGDTVTGVNYLPNGLSNSIGQQAMTQIGSPIILTSTADESPTTKGLQLSAWYLIAPDASTSSPGDAAIVVAGTAHPASWALAAYVLSNATQSAPDDSADGSVSSATTSISTAISGSGDTVMDAIAYRHIWNATSHATVGSGHSSDVQLVDDNSFGIMDMAMQCSSADGASAMGWTSIPTSSSIPPHWPFCGTAQKVVAISGAGGEGCSHLCLEYIVETDHSTYPSTVKISDKIADWDPTNLSAPVFEPVWDQGKGKLIDDGNQLTGLVSHYSTASVVFVENTGFSDSYERWIEPFSDADSVNAGQATARATSIIAYRAPNLETDQCSILMLPEQTALITAGMSIQVKAAVVGGGVYLGEYLDRRVAQLVWQPAADGLYWAHLELARGVRRQPASAGKAQPAGTTPSDAVDLAFDNSSDGLPGSPVNVQDAIDEIAGLIDGGLTGEVLTKTTNADYDFDWAAAGGGGSTLAWFNVTDSAYGAVGDGTTDDTAAINLAIAALNTAIRGVLYFPAGDYKVTGALTAISADVLVRGDGSMSFDGTQWGTRITCTSATAVLFTINGKISKFVDIGLLSNSGGTPSAGSAILVDSAYLEQKCDYENIHVRGFRDCIDVKVGAQWVMNNVLITAPVRYGIRIRNTVNNDAGDWSITNSNIYADAYNATSGIRIETSGGGKIVNTKVNMALSGNKFATGIDLTASGTTVILNIANCSVENVTAAGISVSGSNWKAISIVNSEIGLWGSTTAYPIKFTAGTLGDLSYVTIDNIVALTDVSNTRYVVDLTKIDHATIGQIEQLNFAGKLTTSGCTNITDNTALSAPPAFATPAIVLGSAAAGGAATTVIRSDSTIVAFDATAPTTQALGDSAATGSAAVATRRDHVHGMPALGTTAANVGASAGGAATTPSKSDHVHATGAGTPVTQAFGDAAAVGSGPAAAMTDHKHGMPAAPTATGTDDHIHTVGEALTGDGAATVFLLANEAVPGTVATYNVAGARVAATLGGANDQVTYSVQPGTGTFYLDYIPVQA